jgi:penicillin-binding protein 1A
LYSNNKLIKNYGNNDEIKNYAEFPFNLVNALISTEDRKFFSHNGFDYFGILRALFTNIRYGYIKQGGSTITQQLAKILLKNNKKTYTRKVQELLLSLQIEKRLTKEEIILLYLNKSYFGAGQYGIQQASTFYFQKRVTDLNLEECAMLIGLLKAPSRYTPQNSQELSAQRTKQVIINMYNAGFLEKTNYDSIGILETATGNLEKKLNLESYFSDWVNTQISDYTDNKNISVKTTLNEKIQLSIENTIKEIKPKNQVAIVVINKNGAVLGMTGGVDYNKSEFNRAIYGSRQAGSSFKLFVFLAGMIQKGFTPKTIFIDEAVAIGKWFPENYNKKYYGEVTMKESFAKSLNSVSVQIGIKSKIKNVAKIAKKMGIISPIDDSDPTIMLGTTQVNLLELSSSYAVLVNYGNAVIPYSIEEIENDNKKIYSRKASEKYKILNEEILSNMQEMMRETMISGTGKNGYINGLNIGGKTGTTQNSADAWFVGYVGDIVIGVWIGNDDNSGIKGMSGSELPVKIWKEIVKKLMID